MDTILGVLRIAITNEMDKRYIKYLTKNIDLGIDFVEPIKTIIIPKKIYVEIINEKDDPRQIIVDLLKLITEEYSINKKIPNSNNDPIGRVVGKGDSLEVFSTMAFSSQDACSILINVSQIQQYEIYVVKKIPFKLELIDICIPYES